MVADFQVYILVNEELDKYYVGQTSDLDKRVYRHNHFDSNSYTSRYRPWRLIWNLGVSTRSTAMQVEKYIKSKKSKRYIKCLIVDIEMTDNIREKFGISGG